MYPDLLGGVMAPAYPDARYLSKFLERFIRFIFPEGGDLGSSFMRQSTHAYGLQNASSWNTSDRATIPSARLLKINTNTSKYSTSYKLELVPTVNSVWPTAHLIVLLATFCSSAVCSNLALLSISPTQKQGPIVPPTVAAVLRDPLSPPGSLPYLTLLRMISLPP